MISKITQELLNIIKKDKYKPFTDILQTADNVIIFTRDQEQFKTTITRVKNN